LKEVLAAREKNPGIKLVYYGFGILCIISLALSLGGIWLQPIKKTWAALRHLIATFRSG